MSTSTTETFETWKDDETPFSILYTKQLLLEINFSVVEGFRKIPHGGIEAGGLLFGTRDTSAIRLVAQRPIACQHQSGPSFILSVDDIAALRSQLETYQSDEALRSLEPLGWFIAHNRSGLQMNDKEAEHFAEFFPHPWQVTLLARPDKANPTRFGFVFRRADGSFERDAGKSAFDYTGPSMALPQFNFETARRERGKREFPPADAPVAERAAAAPPIAKRRDESLADKPSEPAKKQAEKPAMIPAPEKAERQEAEQKTIPAPVAERPSVTFAPTVPAAQPPQKLASATAPTVAKEETPPIPELPASHTAEKPRPSSLWTSVAALILGMLIAGGPAWWWHTQRLPGRIELNAWDNNGKLTIFWPSVEIRAAENGYLVIRENGRARRIDLRKQQLDSGRFTFDRQTDNVAIELHALESNRESVGMVRFVNGKRSQQETAEPSTNPDSPNGAQLVPQSERQNQRVNYRAKKKKKWFFFF